MASCLLFSILGDFIGCNCPKEHQQHLCYTAQISLCYHDLRIRTGNLRSDSNFLPALEMKETSAWKPLEVPFLSDWKLMMEVLRTGLGTTQPHRRAARLHTGKRSQCEYIQQIKKKNTSALDMLTSFSENTTTHLSNKEICLFKMCFDSTSISSLSHLLNTPIVLLRELPLATRFTKQVFEVPGLGMSPRALCMLGKHSATGLPLYDTSSFGSFTIWFKQSLFLALCSSTQNQGVLKLSGEMEEDQGTQENLDKSFHPLSQDQVQDQPGDAREGGLQGNPNLFPSPLNITVYSHISSLHFLLFLGSEMTAETSGYIKESSRNEQTALGHLGSNDPFTGVA